MMYIADEVIEGTLAPDRCHVIDADGAPPHSGPSRGCVVCRDPRAFLATCETDNPSLIIANTAWRLRVGSVG